MEANFSKIKFDILRYFKYIFVRYSCDVLLDKILKIHEKGNNKLHFENNKATYLAKQR